MVDVIAVQQAQATAVREIAASVTTLQDGDWGDREWERLAANVEIATDGGRRISSQTAVVARHPGQPLEELDFRLSRAAKDALVALREAMQDDKGAWNSCDVVVERSGKFRFDFSYDPPRRLDGDLLHSPLTGFLDRYRDETGAA